MLNVKQTIKTLCRRARLHDVVVVGPVVWYAGGDNCPYPGAAPDDRVWASVVAASHETPHGPEFHSDIVLFGLAAAEAPEWAYDCSSVVEVRTLRHPHEVTREEAGKMRVQLAEALRKRFADSIPVPISSGRARTRWSRHDAGIPISVDRRSLRGRYAGLLATQAPGGAAEIALRKRPRPSRQRRCALRKCPRGCRRPWRDRADAARALTHARRSVAVHHAAAIGLGPGQGRGEGRGRRHGGDGLLRQTTEWRRSGERQCRRGNHGSKLHAHLLPKTCPTARARPLAVAARSAPYLTAENAIGPVRREHLTSTHQMPARAARCPHAGRGVGGKKVGASG